MKKIVSLRLVTLVVALCFNVSASEIEWQTEYATAKREAKERDLPLFILFTNTHSCPPCIRLERTVFTTDEFESAAENDFVPVLVDFAPLYTAGQAGRREDIIELRKSIGIPDSLQYKGWPYLFLLDPDGEILFHGNLGRLKNFDDIKTILESN